MFQINVKDLYFNYESWRRKFNMLNVSIAIYYKPLDHNGNSDN